MNREIDPYSLREKNKSPSPYCAERKISAKTRETYSLRKSPRNFHKYQQPGSRTPQVSAKRADRYQKPGSRNPPVAAALFCAELLGTYTCTMYVYIYMYCSYIYIYIYRERDILT